jgi:glycogen debranching enzyme
MMSVLELLKNRIDLVQVPFTDMETRFLLFYAKGYFRLCLAEYETPLEKTTVLHEWYFTDNSGQVLALEITSYPDRLECHTVMGVFRIAFVDPETLLVTLPPNELGVHFKTHVTKLTFDEKGFVGQLHDSDLYLSGTTDARVHKAQVNLEQEIKLSLESREGNQFLLQITNSPSHRKLPNVFDTLARNYQCWQDWFERAPRVLDHLQPQYYFAWWVMRVNLIRLRFMPEVLGMIPSKFGYVGVWHWDSYFHAIALRHVDANLAKDQFRILFKHQFPSGMIPDVIHDAGVLAFSSDMVASDVVKSLSYVGHDSDEGKTMMQAPITKPPLTAWAAWKVFEQDKDTSFLTEFYDSLVKWQAWWFRECDSDQNGLPEFQHPYSSGIDDGPLWDLGPPLESPDLISYLIVQYGYLARIAKALHFLEDERQWREKAHDLVQRFVALRWDEGAGWFWAHKGHEIIKAKTPFNLYPLITGYLPTAIADKLVGHLKDERLFWGQYPVPTVAYSDENFNPERMWRGPVWLNPNYLLIDGLLCAGYQDEARMLRKKTLRLVCETPNAMNEYYHPRSGEKPPRATIMFGWTAALFIDLCISETLEVLSERTQ